MIHTERNIRPAIKPGVTLRYLSQDFIALETPDRRGDEGLVMPVRFHEIELVSLLKSMDGAQDLRSLAHITSIGIDDLESLIAQLASHSLIDTTRTPIPYLNRYSSESQRIEEVSDVELLPEDLAVTTFLQRCEIESSAMTFHPGVVDGGRSALLVRRDFAIEIYGNDRIAIALAANLAASGFSRISFSQISQLRNRTDLRITPLDVLGTLYRSSDVGKKKSENFEDLLPEFSIFSSAEKSEFGRESKVDLVIVTEPPAPEAQQMWMSEGISHLAIRREVGGIIRIGPFVEPGKSPCLRCVELSESQLAPLRESVIRETPASLTSLIAGVMCADVASIALSARSVFLATTARYSLRDFLHPIEKRWEPHPGCGCFWR